jgi:starch-binding outer membrane protein, SusD/RagB family
MILSNFYNWLLRLNMIWLKCIVLLCLLSTISCKKYLDVKPDEAQAVPSTLEDLQALLNSYNSINVNYPGLLVIASDEYYLPTATYGSRNVNDRNNYIWDANATFLNAWRFPYQIVYYSNVVLQELPKIQVNDNNIEIYNSIKGQALFLRSFAFYHLAQLYCQPYSSTANTDLGIPLRLVPDIGEKSTRSTVEETYNRIITDFKEAIELLPETVPVSSRPNRAAAYGALARTYLSMRDYENAGKNADLCLKQYGTLMDYTTLNQSAPKPIARFNSETIFHSIMAILTVPNAAALIDTTLYQSYSSNDLRKTIFFTTASGGFSFKGSYDGTGNAFTSFCGIATDEMYLTRAECSARAGLKDSSMNDLNRLLKTRWKTNTYVPFIASSPQDALSKILLERKKELIFRGLRWSDLRRLNLEGANISLKRIVNGTSYVLPPSDPRWVMLIPLEVTSVTDMQQNPR